jgi:hypothetical protein
MKMVIKKTLSITMGLQGQLDELLRMASITYPEDEETNNPIWFQQDRSSQFVKLAGFRYVCLRTSYSC